jgi:acyl transferase domain-containing protein
MQVDQLLLLEAAYRAVEDAGLTLEQLHSTATGVFAAAYTNMVS